jgi:hypothetical protein
MKTPIAAQRLLNQRFPKETLNKCSFRRNGVDSFSVKAVAVKMAAGVAELRRGPFLWQPRRGGTKMPIAAKKLFIQRFPKADNRHQK